MIAEDKDIQRLLKFLPGFKGKIDGAELTKWVDMAQTVTDTIKSADDFLQQLAKGEAKSTLSFGNFIVERNPTTGNWKLATKSYCYVPNADGSDKFPANGDGGGNSTTTTTTTTTGMMTTAAPTPAPTPSSTSPSSTNSTLEDGSIKKTNNKFFDSLTSEQKFSPFNLCLLSTKEVFKLITGEVACIMTVATPEFVLAVKCNSIFLFCFVFLSISYRNICLFYHLAVRAIVCLWSPITIRSTW
jgi:hypothetical protein